MESIVKPVLSIVGLEGRYRTIYLRFTVYKPSHAIRDFPQPGDIESHAKIFASTAEIAAGNDAATMFTQTPRVETIHQDSRMYVLEDSLQLSLRSFVCTMCLDVNRAVLRKSAKTPARNAPSLYVRIRINAWMLKLILKKKILVKLVTCI